MHHLMAIIKNLVKAGESFMKTGRKGHFAKHASHFCNSEMVRASLQLFSMFPSQPPQTASEQLRNEPALDFKEKLILHQNRQVWNNVPLSCFINKMQTRSGKIKLNRTKWRWTETGMEDKIDLERKRNWLLNYREGDSVT